MKPVLQTVLFTILVPGTVGGLLPWYVRGSQPASTGLDLWLGVLTLGFGLAIYLHTAFWGFALHGLGTPAPIAPTKKLVVEGLHRYIRNPMYVGVLLIILGQAIMFHSVRTLLYAACFCAVVQLFVLFYEEPTLSQQFGEEYAEYKQRVPRWLPRIQP